MTNSYRDAVLNHGSGKVLGILASKNYVKHQIQKRKTNSMQTDVILSVKGRKVDKGCDWSNIDEHYCRLEKGFNFLLSITKYSLSR